MKAAVVHAFNAPPRYTTFADPVAMEGEKLVTVSAAGLHPIVKGLARGTHYGSSGELPFIAGIDGVGKLEDGSRVYFGIARSPFGTFAERSLAASWMCLPLPEAVDDVTAAGIANPAMSSWVALKARAKFVAGESVLILGATGVAGQLAVQVAKRLGARRIIAAGRNSEALEKMRTLGANAVISLDQEQASVVSAFRSEIAEAGVDVVLDYLWGQPAELVFQAISQKGLRKASARVRFIQIGESAGRTISLTAATLRSSGLELLGSGFGSASLEQIRETLAQFFQAVAKEPFEFRTKAAPLAEIGTLWDNAEAGTRVVFQPWSLDSHLD
jgi:NADPH:quinone reductase-like Zn-dependent oxidoreductase